MDCIVHGVAKSQIGLSNFHFTSVIIEEGLPGGTAAAAAAAAKSLQPTRLRRPWDSPGKNTRVGCHFLLLVVKNLPANVGEVRDEGLITGLGRSPGKWHGNSLQYSCLESSTDRGAWQATVHRVAKSRTRLK